MKKPTVAIAIAALNEHHNLVRLLHEIKLQAQEHYSLKQIYIYSDGSSDQTSRLLTYTDYNLPIKLILGKTRKGKPYRINQLFNLLDADIAVVMDADITLLHDQVIDQLIKPIQEDNADLCSGTDIPLPPQSTVEKIAMAGVQIWQKVRSQIEPDSVYNCEGMLRAFSASVYRAMRFPLVGGIEDTYPYYWVKSHQYRFAFVANARVGYRLPSSIKEYLSQQRRYLTAPKLEQLYCPLPTAKDYRPVSNLGRISALSSIFLKNPLWTSLYLTFSIYVRISLLFHSEVSGQTWEVLNSTKNI